MNEAADYSVTDVLRDGATIAIRAIRPDDKSRLLRHFQGLSPESIYHRFFGLKRSLNQEDLRRLTELDFVRHVGLAATIDSGGDEKFIGIGRYIRKESGSCAEVAFAVLDEYQGHGIGTLLLTHLAKLGRIGGVARFEARVMGDNEKMLEVFANSGFRHEESYDSGVVLVTMDIGASQDR